MYIWVYEYCLFVVLIKQTLFQFGYINMPYPCHDSFRSILKLQLNPLTVLFIAKKKVGAEIERHTNGSEHCQLLLYSFIRCSILLSLRSPWLLATIGFLLTSPLEIVYFNKGENSTVQQKLKKIKTLGLLSTSLMVWVALNILKIWYWKSDVMEKFCQKKKWKKNQTPGTCVHFFNSESCARFRNLNIHFEETPLGNRLALTWREYFWIEYPQ